VVFNAILIVFLAISTIRVVVSVIALCFSIRWFTRSGHSLLNTGPRVLVIIPVLREQTIIESTIRHFLLIDEYEQTTILVVTTEKELSDNSPAGTRNTIDVVDNLVSELSQAGEHRVKAIHFPSASGRMVDQLNFALAHLDELSIGTHDFVAVYNADSRPPKETFGRFNGLVTDPSRRALQQSAVFLSNYTNLGSRGFITGRILQANAILQSRWTFAHELPRFWRQSSALLRFHRRLFLAHCVGHGLFLRRDLLESIGGFPTGTVTEDLFLGYLLSVRGEPIFPIPALEMAESPSTLGSMLKQKYVWFFGPMDHGSYYKLILSRFGRTIDRPVALWLALQGLLPCIFWMFQGTAIITLLVLAFARLGIASIVSVGILFLYSVSYVITTIGAFRIFGASGSKIERNPFHLIGLMPLSLVASILHSVPPWLSFVVQLRHRIFRIEPGKPKTER